jgi:anti-sigma regulatory factor (Ser/Thr protein kinase)
MRQSVPTSTWAVSFSRVYPARPDQARSVRNDLRALLGECSVADEVVLCGSELAANAALHSDSRRPGGTLSVCAEIRDGDCVHLEVSDDGGAWAAPKTETDRPHGLDLIAAFAAEWGITETPGGRTVWARFDWPLPSQDQPRQCPRIKNS